MKTIMNLLIDKLKLDNYFTDENGEIIKGKVQASAINCDQRLISVLLENEKLKQTFFKNVNNVLIFDRVEFSWIVNNMEFLPDSFTSYKNKIGLTSDNDYLINNDDVVLSFPFKDCLLEFDSTTDIERREEIFLNEVLAKEYIDILLDEKALVNVKKYFDKVDSIGFISKKENLLIKGNNLIALHTLKKQYTGEVKCIYWDILYNTNSDIVPYNDSFKHSSWLVMMKNRLEIAKQLLTEDGIIFIHLDSNEMAYLKVLMDEIFTRDNYMGTITCKVKAPSGVASGAQMIFDCSEYILAYAKNFNKVTYNDLTEDAEVVDENSKTSNFYKYLLENLTLENMEFVADISGDKLYKVKSENYKIEKMNDLSSESYYKNYKKIFRTAALSGGREKEVANFLKTQKNANDNLYVFEHTPSKGKRAGHLCHDLIYKSGGVLMLSDFVKVDNKNKRIIKTQHITSIFFNDWWQGISAEGDVNLNNGKKPEILLKTLIEMATQKGDIVLDAFFGTGTTGAVAMKMGRKFVGIEQLESHYLKSIARLSNVINGDQTGISKEVNWHGGGSFISCELMSRNLSEIEKIKNITASSDAIVKLDYLMNNPFILNYKIDTDVVSYLSIKDDFIKLDLDTQKKVLISILDKNLLYVNYSDIEDKSVEISEKDKKFNKLFYGDQL